MSHVHFMTGILLIIAKQGFCKQYFLHLAALWIWALIGIYAASKKEALLAIESSVDSIKCKSTVVFSNMKRILDWAFLGIWKHTNLCNKGVFSFIILLPLSPKEYQSWTKFDQYPQRSNYSVLSGKYWVHLVFTMEKTHFNCIQLSLVQRANIIIPKDLECSRPGMFFTWSWSMAWKQAWKQAG